MRKYIPLLKNPTHHDLSMLAFFEITYDEVLEFTKQDASGNAIFEGNVGRIINHMIQNASENAPRKKKINMAKKYKLTQWGGYNARVLYKMLQGYTKEEKEDRVTVIRTRGESDYNKVYEVDRHFDEKMLDQMNILYFGIHTPKDFDGNMYPILVDYVDGVNIP